MNAVAQVHVMAPRRMTADDYCAERERIRQTYGDNAKDANGLREQALAALYYSSGWTQEELAKVEDCDRSKMARRLLFGRFLANVPNGTKPKNLTEGRFRSYWEKTEKKHNERQRFSAVLKLIEDETRLVAEKRPLRELARPIIDRFSDGKFHGVDTIAKHVDATEEDVRDVLNNMRWHKSYGCMAQMRQAGKSHQYRITHGQESKAVRVSVLMKELRPLLDGLLAEGKKNSAHISGAEIQTLTGRIEKLIEQLAK